MKLDAAAENELLRQALGELQVQESIAQEAAADQSLQETIDRITAKRVACFGDDANLALRGFANRSCQPLK